VGAALAAFLLLRKAVGFGEREERLCNDRFHLLSCAAILPATLLARIFSAGKSVRIGINVDAATVELCFANAKISESTVELVTKAIARLSGVDNVGA
jgi:hypothetical protein